MTDKILKSTPWDKNDFLAFTRGHRVEDNSELIHLTPEDIGCKTKTIETPFCTITVLEGYEGPAIMMPEPILIPHFKPIYRLQ